ncbi:hypothetical protein OAS39_11525 [Pirellulales bacterium]|nr:hypothetical protein [Pirellulales bacterium]
MITDARWHATRLRKPEEQRVFCGLAGRYFTQHPNSGKGKRSPGAAMAAPGLLFPFNQQFLLVESVEIKFPISKSNFLSVFTLSG